jgi:type 1 glutamine amidotransferase
MLLVTMAGLLFSSSPGRGAVPIRVMILDGESAGSYHDWRAVTEALQQQLLATGRFSVEIVTVPPAGADPESFSPEFAKYQAVVFNYDAPDERWPTALKRDFETYMAEGGGLVIVHAASNAFPGWREFNEMTGVGGWRNRNEQAGPYWYLQGGRLIADHTPGVAGSHGRRIPFLVTLQERHPITEGLSQTWLHAPDELYAHLRGPGKGMRVIASAFSDPANQGSGRNEPVMMVLGYGQGRVFHTTLGHDVVALGSDGFRHTFTRGVEWAATGAIDKAP